MADFDVVTADVTVVGGGMAGVCAALASARLGRETVLVNDRPVLGGNASSEVRVWVNGATGGHHCRYAREGGIMEELLLRNKHDNQGGDPDVWDAILVDAVRRQANLTLHLNTLVTDVETDGDRVVAVIGHQHMTERRYRFEGAQFVDATGDGVLAAKAGAEWVMGREAASEFGEAAAPEEADSETLGATIMFQSKRTDHEVAFSPPSFAHDFRESPPDLVAQRVDPDREGVRYWWFEYGGRAGIDPIADSEEVRDELWAIVYGVWDYIKNSGAFPDEEVATLQLEWVGKIPGKRESRRIRGDHVLTESDVISQRRFADAVGHGGWSIDLHPPAGLYDDQGRGSMHYHIDGPYTFPYRCLYARDLANVFLAGRHLSASHVAFGTMRVMMTLAVAGQAAGTAAACCRERDLDPAGLASSEDGVRALQQHLLREDQWIPGVENEDPTDLARGATITASSEQPPALTEPTTTVDLDSTDIGLHFAHEGRIDAVELLLEGIDEATDLTIECWSEGRPENVVPDAKHGETTVRVPADGPGWVEVPVDLDAGDGQGVFLVLKTPAGVRVHGQERELTGVMALPRTEDGPAEKHSLLPNRDDFWGVSGVHAYTPLAWVPCFRVDPPSQSPLYAPDNVVDGYARPYGLGHSWMSRPFEPGDGSGNVDGDGTGNATVDRTESGAVDGAENVAAGDRTGAVAGDPEWIEFRWDEPRTVSVIQLVTNTRLNEWYNNLGYEPRTVPETVRDYRIEIATDGGWEPIVEERGNYQRFRRHVFDPIEIDRFRIVVEATNGAPWAELFEVRAYESDRNGTLGPR